VAWGGVEQGSFLNAVIVARDPQLDGHGWLQLGQQLERAAERIRGQRWGPRTLDVDLVSCSENGTEIVLRAPDLTLPHPLAHLRAFVLVPWLDIDPDARLTIAGAAVPVTRLLEDIEPVDKAGVMPTDLTLRCDA